MTTSLTATVLVENTPVEGLAAEHGLSVYLCHERDGQTTRALLDFGHSDAFVRNAGVLGIDLASVDLAVLSHAHYDHADGMPAFFAANGSALVHLSEACAEDCFSTKGGTTGPNYIGIRHEYLQRYESRLQRTRTDRTTTIAPGVHLVPHTMRDLAEAGRRSGMYRSHGGIYRADDFAHELSLVIELAPAADGVARLAVFNSCSHAGLPVITSEVAAAFPSARIAAYAGGLHLVHASEEQIRQVAEAIRAAGIEQLYTGHCTGDHAVYLLKYELPGCVTTLQPGMTFQL